MEERNSLYLVVISIILGVSVLKLTDLFQLGGQLKVLLSDLTSLSIPVVSIFISISGYLLFFIMVAITTYAITKQISYIPTEEIENRRDLGSLVGLCVIILVISYIAALAVVTNNIIPIKATNIATTTQSSSTTLKVCP